MGASVRNIWGLLCLGGVALWCGACALPTQPGPFPADRGVRPGTAPAATLPPAVDLPQATPPPAPGTEASPTVSPVPPTPTTVANPGPSLRPLTDAGCCTQPFWSADGRQVLFIDRPSADEPVGIYGVDVDNPGRPTLVSRRLGIYTAAMDFIQEVKGGGLVLERLADGRQWTVSTGGETVHFSPGRTRIAWTAAPDVLVEDRVSQLWVADLDGGNARQVAQLPRGGIGGWLDENSLLVSDRADLQSATTRLQSLNIESGERRLLAEEERLRSVEVAPGGEWIAYMVTQNPDRQRNGLWVAAADATQTTRLPDSLFGAFQWRNEAELLIVPFDPTAEWHGLLSYHPDTGTVVTLVDPAVTPIKIANGDWQVSPDGNALVFLAYPQKNLWLLGFEGN